MMQTVTLGYVSSKPAQAIADQIDAVAADFKFSVIHRFDFFNLLQEKGFPINKKVFVFEICQAKMASNMLNAFPAFSVLMPCKIAVYEEKGTTKITTLNMDPFLPILSQEPALAEEAGRLFQNLKAMMEALVK